LIERLAAMPVREDYTQNPTDREWMTLYLGWGFRRGINPEALTLLLEAGKRDASLRGDISHMVEGVDDPDAAEFLVRNLAARGGSNLCRTRPASETESLERCCVRLRRLTTYAACGNRRMSR
jgi:hypothetical protein